MTLSLLLYFILSLILGFIVSLLMNQKKPERCYQPLWSVLNYAILTSNLASDLAFNLTINVKIRNQISRSIQLKAYSC